MKNIKGILTFGAGLVVGALASYIVTRNKYEEILQEEIDSVKETYKKRAEMGPCKLDEEDEEVKEEKNTTEVEEEFTEEEHSKYNNIVSESGYVNYTKYAKKDEEVEEQERIPVTDPYDRPYVINAEEYGEEVGYDTMTLTYFADKVLVDDLDDIVENPDDVVGLDNLRIFEEFGASTVYVRNDVLMVDYEIMKDDFKYSDLQDDLEDTVRKPHQV